MITIAGREISFLKSGYDLFKIFEDIGDTRLPPYITKKLEDSENIEEYNIHSEYISLEEEMAQRLNAYKAEGKRIIAVGTTSVCVLESFSNNVGKLSFGSKQTNIYIYPGYAWKYTDALITNFHLPKSTLLILVSSFAGHGLIMQAYNYAVENKFRFFSFGDVMLIE